MKPFRSCHFSFELCQCERMWAIFNNTVRLVLQVPSSEGCRMDSEVSHIWPRIWARIRSTTNWYKQYRRQNGAWYSMTKSVSHHLKFGKARYKPYYLTENQYLYCWFSLIQQQVSVRYHLPHLNKGNAQSDRQVAYMLRGGNGVARVRAVWKMPYCTASTLRLNCWRVRSDPWEAVLGTPWVWFQLIKCRAPVSWARRLQLHQCKHQWIELLWEAAPTPDISNPAFLKSSQQGFFPPAGNWLQQRKQQDPGNCRNSWLVWGRTRPENQYWALSPGTQNQHTINTPLHRSIRWNDSVSERNDSGLRAAYLGLGSTPQHIPIAWSFKEITEYLESSSAFCNSPMWKATPLMLLLSHHQFITGFTKWNPVTEMVFNTSWWRHGSNVQPEVFLLKFKIGLLKGLVEWSYPLSPVNDSRDSFPHMFYPRKFTPSSRSPVSIPWQEMIQWFLTRLTAWIW